MDGDRCVEISFHDEESIFGGTIRKSPLKHEIVYLASGLKHLKKLNLRKCKLGSIPRMLSTDLEYIDISCNDLDSVPAWVLRQEKLKFLSLGANRIAAVPDLGGLPLEFLKLHKNPITQMPKVGRLKSLNLFLCPMAAVPRCVPEMDTLEAFTFGVTKATDIPSLANLKRLRWLTVAVNDIESVPEDICSLERLEGLQLAKNKIGRLPDAIGDLNVSSLGLYSNRIAVLPESFYKLRLKKLNLAGNPLADYGRITDVFGGIDFLRT
jgi:Leucine-rich repeat (LRR) protein